MAKILVVEDERRLAETVKRGLEREGFAVDLAFDGADGAWLARESRYDALVLDMMLPGMSGLDICEQLRAADDHTPVLMLTARDGPRDIAGALDAGADDYLVKPFAFVVLVARLRALLRRRGEQRSPVVTVGSLVVDTAARRCQRGGDAIELTAREFAVLEYLASRPDQVVSKLDIIEGVWDFAFEGDPNIVEVYIRRLRRKIDEPYGAHTIQTVRGAGYRLDAAGA
jgi:DNA-binding response OmpR family regulator